MKKRKQLDALVSNGKASNGKRTLSKNGSGSCSTHELLKPDTDSSDMEDFSILQSRRPRKKGRSRLHLSTICLSLCQFVLITTCILVSGTLVWLHIGLREDLDTLRSHLQKVEAGNKNTPEALHFTHNKLKQLDSNLTYLYQEIQRNTLEINNATTEIKGLKDILLGLQASIDAAPAIKQLPKMVNSLSERVATFGSKISAMDTNVKELKDSQSALQNVAQNLTGELDSVKSSLQELSNASKSNVTNLLTRPFVRDVSFQTSIEETKQRVYYLQMELVDLVKSVDNFNSTLNNQMSILSDLTMKVQRVNDTVNSNINNTHSQSAKLFAMENYLYTNLSLSFTHLENECAKNLEKIHIYANNVSEIQDLVNQSILHIVNSVFYEDPSLSVQGNNTTNLNFTHNFLLLLAGLLKQFPRISPEDLAKDADATKSVTNLLNSTLLELSKKNPTKSTHNVSQNELSKFIQNAYTSDLKTKTSENNTQPFDSEATTIMNNEDSSTQSVLSPM